MAGGEIVSQRDVEGVKTRRTADGGWSQKRFQRHVENFHLHHIKDVVEALERIVQQEEIAQILLAGDEVVMPLLREQMPKHLAERVVDNLRIATNAPLADVIRLSLDAMKGVNARTDRQKVDAAVGEFRAGGLGVVGPEDTLDALVKGQVDELLLSASLGDLKHTPGGPRPPATEGAASTAVAGAAAGEAAGAEGHIVQLADELVTKARQTSARITFIEDRSLLKDWGGVAALLRFRI
jgi:peptide chain release factor subunit 1